MSIFKQILSLFIHGDSNYIKMVEKYGQDFSIVPQKNTVKAVWKKWPKYRHYTSDQYWRRKRALEQPTPLCIDLENLTGKFLGSEGELYDATLVSCDCKDFLHRCLPCKHIYRLYFDIENNNSLTLDVGVNNALIIKQYGEQETPPLKSLNGIPISAMQFLVSISKDLVTKQYAEVPKLTQDITTLIDCGILSTSMERDYASLLNQMTKDGIILALAKKSVSGYKVHWTKAKLIEWILESQSKFLEKNFSKTVRVIVQEDKKDYVQKLYENKSRCDKSPSYTEFDFVP